MKKIHSLEDLLEHELRDIYHAEKQLLKALPKLAKAASSEQLRETLERHAKQTEGQISRLEQAFKKLGKSAVAEKCVGMEGLIEEAEDILSDDVDDEVRDAAIIAAAQKTEHYEICAYGTTATWAKMLGFEEVADLLAENLDEEETADELLTDLAKSSVNEEALRGRE
jgi:ferritin-like metal-binding protein YciE